MRCLRWLSEAGLPALRRDAAFNLLPSPHNHFPRPISTAAAASCRQTVTLPSIPELYDPNFLDILLPKQNGLTRDTKAVTIVGPRAETQKNAMMEALKTSSHQTLTANLAPTYSSTLSPTLDAFQILGSARTLQEFDTYLRNSWAEDPALTLRIIWNIRSIHDGKSNQKLFYRAFGWLYKYHPRTAIQNLPKLVEPVCTTPKNRQGMSHGYWKDLLNIVTLAAVDELYIVGWPTKFLNISRCYPRRHRPSSRREPKKEDPDATITESLARDARNKKMARDKRAVIADERHANLVKKLAQPKFRALYIAVARLFSDRLSRDLHILKELASLAPDVDRRPLLRQISLAGKWAPSPMASHDRHTNMATAIALLLRHSSAPLKYPSALDTQLEPKEAAIILRSFYQRWILTPLRSTLAITEPLMSAKRWDEIEYNRVPSVCMKNNMDHFFMHDRVRFQKYLTSVENGRQTISGATLLPHKLVAQVMDLGKPLHVGEDYEFTDLAEFKRTLQATRIRVVEAQWKTLIDRLRESGSLDNALAICDVSASMFWKPEGAQIEPYLPAISLSLVLASLAKPPFNGGFITFSANPKFVQLDLTQSLFDMVKQVKQSDWGMNTDFDAVFLKLLLPLAVRNKVPPEDMIKRLFVFSDMQFDDCVESKDASQWKTNHAVIEEAYKAAGYDMPEIVYWDLSHYGTVEVSGDREGVALMNGFSPAMMKVFIGESEAEQQQEVDEDSEVKTSKVKEKFNPITVMKKALMNKSFDGLVIVD